MGFFSDLNKKRKKLTKKLTPKFLRKTISKIGEFGKKVVSTIGKVVNKLGPIGTMAISVIAPYAAAAMVNMGGVMGAIGTAMQTVGSAASTIMQAPGKLLGQVAGKAVSSLGGAASSALSNVGAETLSKGMTTITEKLTAALGYEGGGSLSDGISKVFGDVKSSIEGITYKTTDSMMASAEEVLGKAALDDKLNVLSTPDTKATAIKGLTDIQSKQAQSLLMPQNAVVEEAVAAGYQARGLDPFRVENMLSSGNIGEVGILGINNPVDPRFDVTNLANKTSPTLSEVGKKLYKGTKSLLSKQPPIQQQPQRDIQNPTRVTSQQNPALSPGAGVSVLSKADFEGQELSGAMSAEQLYAMQNLMFNRGM